MAAGAPTPVARVRRLAVEAMGAVAVEAVLLPVLLWPWTPWARPDQCGTASVMLFAFQKVKCSSKCHESPVVSQCGNVPGVGCVRICN